MRKNLTNNLKQSLLDKYLQISNKLVVFDSLNKRLMELSQSTKNLFYLLLHLKCKGKAELAS